jgi:hypothetical protein
MSPRYIGVPADLIMVSGFSPSGNGEGWFRGKGQEDSRAITRMVENPEDPEGEEGILHPEDLGVEDEEKVEPLDENRFLVSTESDPIPESPDRDEDQDDVRHSEAEEVLGSGVSTTPLSAIDEYYGVDVDVKAEDTVASTRIVSNNVVETFEELLLWYAHQVDDSTPPKEVIEILLAESGFEV